MNYQQMTKQERYKIYILLKAGFSNKAIADQLGQHPSTISRETHRNRGLKGYRPAQAQRFSDQRCHEASKYFKVTDEVFDWIEQLTHQQLSPEQFVDYLKIYRGVSLHHEMVYRYIYADKLADALIYKLTTYRERVNLLAA